jgi:CheY-like chemotaxis protein
VSKQKLLLADDSVTIQKVVNLTFADEGIEVISVGDGDSAMEKILETSPDLIMVDVNMPGLNGYQICEKLRNSQTFRQTPIILLVGSFEPFDEDEAKRVGADDYLTKPFQSIRQLVQKVTALLTAKKNHSFVAQDEPKAEFLTALETTETVLPTEENFPDTLEDYPVQIEKDDFGDVTNDDEMIQTSQFPAFTDAETPSFELEAAKLSASAFDEKTYELHQTEEKDSEPYTPIEHEPEIEEAKPYIPVEEMEVEEAKPYIPVEEIEVEETKPYIPIEHEVEVEQTAEPKPYTPIETEDEIEQKTYTPIEHETETEPTPYVPIEEIGDEPKPYVPVEHDSEIPDKNDEAVNTEAKEDVIENSEVPTGTTDVSLPEMASVLTLDEQNLLEIAPREEDFIIDMDHEQNISADWDFIETRNFTTTEKSQPKEAKDFEIISENVVPESKEPIEENTDTENLDSEVKTENNESPEITEEVKHDEQSEPVTDSENIESKEITDETEKNAEVVETSKSAEHIVSVPNFIASTVVSEVAKENLAVSEELIEVIVNRVMERLSDNVVREIAWEIVPSHTDLIVKKMVQEKLDKD